jgi:hypothetical protein
MCLHSLPGETQTLNFSNLAPGSGRSSRQRPRVGSRPGLAAPRLRKTDLDTFRIIYWVARYIAIQTRQSGSE